MMRVVVVDDEPPARRAMVRLIAAHADLALVGQAGSVPAAAALIAARRPHVAFLDIEMAGMSGFALLGQLSDPPHVVIVTAHAAHAANAFDVEAVDFLLKPVLPSRFAAAVSRLRAAQASATRAAASPMASGKAMLRVPVQRGTRLIELSRILAAHADRDYARLELQGEPPLLIGRSLGQLAMSLPSPPFLRLDRSTIVNLSRLSAFETVSRDRALLRLEGAEAPLELGRAAAAALRRAI